MNQIQAEAPPDEFEPLPDPNADDDDTPAWAPEETLDPPTAEARPALSPGPAAPTPAADLDPAEIIRQNELLQRRLQQESQARQQQAAQAVQTWLAAQPPEKQVEYRRLIEDRMREAEDKRRVMWTIAQMNGLQGKHAEEFYEMADGVADPNTMEKLGARYKRFQELESGAQVAVATKPKPAMARVRPDAGAPAGNRAQSREQRRQELLKPYMPGGPKQGRLEEMDLMLQQNGFYG